MRLFDGYLLGDDQSPLDLLSFLLAILITHLLEYDKTVYLTSGVTSGALGLNPLLLTDLSPFKHD